MLKRFLVVLACISLLFASPIFADELEVKQNIPVMDIESINSSLEKSGFRSLNLEPGNDSVTRAVSAWCVSDVSYSGINQLNDGITAYGWTINITCGSSDIMQNNIVTYYLPNDYFESYSRFVIFDGSCEEYTLEGNVLTIYNPVDVTPGSNTWDFRGVVYGSSPYTNNTGSPINGLRYGLVGVVSTGTELVDVLRSQLNVQMVVEVLVSTIGFCIGLVFMWWGLRKTSGAIMSAFRRGKLRI